MIPSVTVNTVVVILSADFVELLALYILSSLLAPPMVRYTDTSDARRRKWVWRTGVSEIMQASIVDVSVCTFAINKAYFKNFQFLFLVCYVHTARLMNLFLDSKHSCRKWLQGCTCKSLLDHINTVQFVIYTYRMHISTLKNRLDTTNNEQFDVTFVVCETAFLICFDCS